MTTESKRFQAASAPISHADKVLPPHVQSRVSALACSDFCFRAFRAVTARCVFALLRAQTLALPFTKCICICICICIFCNRALYLHFCVLTLLLSRLPSVFVFVFVFVFSVTARCVFALLRAHTLALPFTKCNVRWQRPGNESCEQF